MWKGKVRGKGPLEGGGVSTGVGVHGREGPTKERTRISKVCSSQTVLKK